MTRISESSLACAWAITITMLLTACGESAVPVEDGGWTIPDNGVDVGVAVAPPEIPWLADEVPPVALTPCPDGWHEVTGGPVTECAPYPEAGPLRCDDGEAHFPGEPGCRPIGAPCPVGDYAANLPSDDQIIYVKADAPAGGDGSIDAPFEAVSALDWSLVGAETTIALAKGHYEGPLLLPAGSRVMGACVRDTTLTLSDPDIIAPILVTSGGEAVVVENIMVRDSVRAGAAVTESRGLTLRGVAFERAHTIAVSGDIGTTLTLEDVVIRDTLPHPTDETYGHGIEFIQGAHLTATRVIVSGSRYEGIIATGRRTMVTLADVVVRDTGPQAGDHTRGEGMTLREGVHVEATRLLVTGNRETGILIADDGTMVTLTDTVVRATAPQSSDRLRGHGIETSIGARLMASRVVLAANDGAGIVVAEEGSATLTDVLIRGPEASPEPEVSGKGIILTSGGHLEAVRLLIWRALDMGLHGHGAGSSFALTDVAIRETLPHGWAGEQGLGMYLEGGVSVTAARLVVARNHELSVLALEDGTTVTFTDVVVQDTLPSARNGRWGRALQVQERARIDGERVVLTGARQVGLMAVEGASAEFHDISITDIRVAECALEACPGDSHGHAVSTIDGAVRLENFRIAEAAICGVLIAPLPGTEGSGTAFEPVLDLRSGTVSGSTIGACIQVDGYDITRLTDRVRYFRNESNLAATMLPVPGTTERDGP